MDSKKDTLFAWLRNAVENKDPKIFETVDQPILDALFLYMKDSIPNDIFLVSTTDKMQNPLLLKYTNDINLLNDKFFKRWKVPFTIRRICELVYDPMKYFQRDQFIKFVNSLEKCIYVESDYDYELRQGLNQLVDQTRSSSSSSSLSHNATATTTINKDISMSQIPFLLKDGGDGGIGGDEVSELRIKREYNEFLREIDSVMSVNYEYEDDEDMEEPVGDITRNELEYDEEEEDDDDYVEGETSSDDDEDEEEEDDDEDDDEQETVDE